MQIANKNPSPARVGDIALLGGFSLLVWLIFRSIELEAKEVLILASVMMLLANFVNHPHFMYSYQMFFEIWPEIKKEKWVAYKIRWLTAAIVIPLVLIVLLSLSVYLSLKGDFSLLQFSLGLYAILVGWHYVKQAFGMALLDAAQRKVYWSVKLRRILLWNSYISWMAALVISAGALGRGDFWGVRFPVFKPLLNGYWTAMAAAIAIASAAWTLMAIWRQILLWRNANTSISNMPLAGVIGYLVGIYLWTMLAWLDNKFILVIPFFHSLQYLAIVSKYQKGKNRAGSGVVRPLSKSFLNYFRMMVFGVAAFWVIPGVLDYCKEGKINYFSSGVFVFTAAIWVFINIHHYFIDSVIWKKENPLMKKYIFS
ncbi:hypothetical protein ABL849_31005 [Variovorax sp. 375MFSha3.1]|uniref:hypothetical protein n=1 Tax=unclassified Variovorax TaxID=663243 RepID=UPI003AAABC8E